jgi:hypothetical protein
VEEMYSEFRFVVGATFLDFKELVWVNDENYSCGLKLLFDNGHSLVFQTTTADSESLRFDNEIETVFKEK